MLKAQKSIRITFKTYTNDFQGDSEDQSLTETEEEIFAPNKPPHIHKLPQAPQRLCQSMQI